MYNLVKKLCWYTKTEICGLNRLIVTFLEPQNFLFCVAYKLMYSFIKFQIMLRCFFCTGRVVSSCCISFVLNFCFLDIYRYKMFWVSFPEKVHPETKKLSKFLNM